MGWARRALLTGGIVSVAVALTSCSSGSGSTTPKTRPSTTTSTAPKAETVNVNLLLSGDRTATIVGTAGSCDIPKFGVPTYVFSGADYPSLGPTGSIRITAPIVVANGTTLPATAKILMGDVGLLAPQDGTGITVSKNNRVVTVNTDVTGGPGVTEDINLAPPDSTVVAHLAGTIRCS
jgi:hypothetical protein